MKYHELKTEKQKTKARVGRGISAGQGKTAGRGTKGQGARAGYSKRPGFAGGSNPLMQKLPKLPGFKSHRARTENVYTGQLSQFGSKTIDTRALADAGIISSPYVTVKLIVKGDVTKRLTVKLPKASSAAIAALEAAGGNFEATKRLGRSSNNKKNEKKNKSRDA
jgi:large subunit ribosomal protein L15